MRAFIGIDFSDELKHSISAVQAQLRPLTAGGRWKYVDNFHITLKFLDEINEHQAGVITRAVSETCGCLAPFQLNISKLGSFPGRDCIRVLWLGLGGDVKNLEQLFAAVDEDVSKAGIPMETRRFSPHITIAQDISSARSVAQMAEDIDFSAMPRIYADRLFLFKSEQIANKRIYTKVKEFRFGGKQENQ